MLLSRDHDFHEDEAIEEGRLWHVVVNGSWHWYGHNLLGSPALSCGLGNSSAVKSACFLFPNWSCDLSNLQGKYSTTWCYPSFFGSGKSVAQNSLVQGYLAYDTRIGNKFVRIRYDVVLLV